LLRLIFALLGIIAITVWFTFADREQRTIGLTVVLPLLLVLVWAIRRLQIDWVRVVTSEAKLAATLRSISDAVLTTDSQGRITTMNRSAELFTGWTESDARHRPLAEVLQLRSREDGGLLTSAFAHVLEAREAVQFPRGAALCHRNGSERLVESTGSPIQDQKGHCIGAVLVLRDITVQVLSETTLRASQEMLRQITENVTDIITIHDLDGRRTFRSRGGPGLIEAQPSGIREAFVEVLETDRTRVHEAFATVVRTGQAQRTEYRWHSADGRLLTIESVGTLIRDTQGQPHKVLVVSRDVSDRRRVEEQLRREITFTESVIKSLPGIFFLCDAHQHVLRWNRNFEVVTGRPPEEMPGLDLLDILAPADRDNFLGRLRRCFADGKADAEARIRHGSGRFSSYYITGLRIEANGGQAMIGIGIDISARKSAEETLLATSHRLERQNSALGEQARNPALRGDHLGLAYRAITEVASRTLGVSRASIWFYDQDRSMLHCADLFEHPSATHTSGQQIRFKDCPKYFEALSEGRVIPAHYARNDPRTREFETTYLTPLGITSMLDAPIRSEGKMIGVVCHEHTGSPREWTLDEQSFAGSMADLVALSLEVWQRRQAEQALRDARDSLEIKVTERTRELSEANVRLQELDRLKSEFLATMSHELRTPLNSIIGFTGILRQGLAGPLNPEQSKQLGMVHSSARHLLSLINDLLDLSRIESGRMEIHPELFPVAEVVREVTQSLAPVVAQKALQLTAELAEPDLQMFSDRKKTFQILLNLANNAVKFTEQGSVQVRVSATADEVRFAVSDTGIGIKPEQLQHLFQAFRQVDGSARRVFEGTGLGLYLCKKLVTLLDGSLGVESEFGSGSCFHFSLPRNSPSPPAKTT